MVGNGVFVHLALMELLNVIIGVAHDGMKWMQSRRVQGACGWTDIGIDALENNIITILLSDVR